MQSLEKLKPLGLLLLRVALGATLVFHAYPRLTAHAHAVNAFPGPSLPGYVGQVLAVFEVFGGGLLIIGLFTRGVALLLAVEFGLILARVVPSSGVEAFPRYEQPLLLGATALALMTVGAGLLSFDAFTFESSRKSPKRPKAKA